MSDLTVEERIEALWWMHVVAAWRDNAPHLPLEEFAEHYATLWPGRRQRAVIEQREHWRELTQPLVDALVRWVVEPLVWLIERARR